MGDKLGNEVAVGLARREGPVPPVVFEKLCGVREVEVAREDKGMAQFARLVDERVAEGGVVLAERCVTEVAEEDAFVCLVATPLGDHAQHVGKRRGRR